MASKRVLMVLTSHEDMGVSGKKTGNWFDEVATPYYRFKQSQFDVTIATPLGGPAPIDPLSHDQAFTTDNTRRFEQDPTAQRALANTVRFDQIDVNGFDGVFFPGGYGQLWDLAANSKVIRAIEDWVGEGTPVAMVCHAPGILRDARKPNGEPLVKGMKVTGFTDAEDDELELSPHLLFSLERALTQNGAGFRRSARNWEPNIVEEGALLTGQNPASAGPIAEALASRLELQRAKVPETRRRVERVSKLA